MSPDDTTIPDDEYEKPVLDGNEIYNNSKEEQERLEWLRSQSVSSQLPLSHEQESLEWLKAIDDMDYCKKS